MAANKYEFVETPREDFFCPVSMELLLDAKQTSCCGSHLSAEMAEKLEEGMKPCPMCNSQAVNTVKDLYFRRLVGEVKVYCSNKSTGCKWEGEVRSLERHLGKLSVDGECKHVSVQCPYACFRYVKRRKLQHHMREECPKRPSRCNYCDTEGSHSYIINTHLPVCDKFPTHCPNKCGDLLCRSQVKGHTETVCPLQPMQCEFGYAGCIPDSLVRRDLKRHAEENTQLHLGLVASYGRQKDKEIEALKAQVLFLTNAVTNLHLGTEQPTVSAATCDIGFISPGTLILGNFEQMLVKQECWRSSGFYSHIGGYKMCLLVTPSSDVDTDQEGKYLGVYLQMLAGEYDNQLEWPFYGRVRIRMLNQLFDGEHVERELLKEASYQEEGFSLSMVSRVSPEKGASHVWGIKKFWPIKKLQKTTGNTQYLKDGTINFQIMDISLYKRS